MDFNKLIETKAHVYFIGIKGTGMCAFAELLADRGINVSGSDTGEVFYTDEILKELNISYHESFDSSHIPRDAALVIYSAAYKAETNVELAQAIRLGLPLLKYPEALGLYSAALDSTGIAGVHGKTTTTALAGTLIKSEGLPAQVLAGSAVDAFNGRSTFSLGYTYFIAETCEYRKHFLSFHPKRIILTSIESDHQDFYPDYNSIRDAFLEYIRLLPVGGELIFCADDKGTCEAAEIIKKERPDLRFTPYGFETGGDYKIESYTVENGRSIFKLAGIPGLFKLRIPGKHNVLNASAALALLFSLVRQEHKSIGESALKSVALSAAEALEAFSGSKRRSEILGEAGGVLFMDDYGHHPTAIRSTLAGLKQFYPARRLVVSFMPHTYTRTAALFDEFALAFQDAGMLIMHKIYPSARESYSGSVSGETLFEKTKQYHNCVFYSDEALDAVDFLKNNLKAGDIFLTMGAGDNWRLGKTLYAEFEKAALKKGET
ncbi:MAG: UDP-N-acetylmuramate--L-alanine ligase [Spirochaetaceae bacterium]|jgi:UDP-N-acetylmuramate--alanine ligase|nr:UDP-N-acetylmuramate--L-alanine ligase [Spirochaetaceae bacterium]